METPNASDPVFHGQTMNGTLLGIGVGPGDPELLTLKAVRLMNVCDVLAWPAPESGQGLTHQIVEPHLKAGDQEHLPLRLPISSDPFPAQQAYDEAAEILSTRLSAGKSVGVLCEGDPMFYGSFSYLFARLSHNFVTEVIPGVSSPMACASASGWMLASKNEPFTVLPGPMDLEALRKKLETAGSYALMKVGRHFKKIQNLLEEMQLSEEASYVEHASLPSQRVLKLQQVDPQNVPYFSMILVRRHA